MIRPSYERIKNESPICRYSIRFEHPSVKFYEYKWWVFHSGSPCDGAEFLSDRYSMNKEEAFDLIAKLSDESKPCWVYNKRIPRFLVDGREFWDRSSKKWEGVDFADPI